MNLRNQSIEHLRSKQFDVLIIGGGINGAVSAAALAAHGASVALIDAGDFAGATSQESSNLIWGGIKYLENYEFGLVAGLCKSRNELLRSFPSTVKEIRFLTTISEGFRFHPLLMIAGSWLYWLLGRGKTRTPRLYSTKSVSSLEPLVDTTNSVAGIEYSDAYLHDNDARFVFNFIRNAMNSGCVAANYVKSIGAVRTDDGHWMTEAEDQVSSGRFRIRSRVLINATGPYVDRNNALTGIETGYCHQFSKGIHLIVPRVSENHRVLAFFADDGRLFFAIPMANRTCIGTTDTRVKDPQAKITDEDRDFVLSNINSQMKLSPPLTKSDVIAERCGVRPLAIRKGQDSETDFLQLSRKHVVEVDDAQCHISIFGGKLTDCLSVGNEICEQVLSFGISLTKPKKKWYGEPGSTASKAHCRRAHALGLDNIIAHDTREQLSTRLWRRYGEQANLMLDAIEKDPSLAEPVIENAGIRRCEIDYLANSEMIVKLEDYLRRRSKIGLLVSREKLRNSRGLFAACETWFGAEAQSRFDEYFGEK
jgi:glycerol-3-phosphate dehydrogenase